MAKETILANAKLILANGVMTGTITDRNGKDAGLETDIAAPRGLADSAEDFLARHAVRDNPGTLSTDHRADLRHFGRTSVA